MACAASSSVDGETPPTKKLKLEPPDDNAAVAPGTAAVAPGTERAIADGLSLATLQNWVKHRWEEIVKENEHPLQYLRHALKSKEAKKEFCKSALTHVDRSSKYEVNMHEQGCLGRCPPD